MTCNWASTLECQQIDFPIHSALALRGHRDKSGGFPYTAGPNISTDHVLCKFAGARRAGWLSTNASTFSELVDISEESGKGKAMVIDHEGVKKTHWK